MIIKIQKITIAQKTLTKKLILAFLG